MSKHIPLQGGKVSLVDDADYDPLSQYEWFASNEGYAVGFMPTDDGKYCLQYMHRIILQPPGDKQVDHVNGNTLDNRRSNLRIATPQQNIQNKRISPLSETGLKGVGWHKDRRKYHARIQFQGIRYHLGFFTSAERAALTYDAAARLLFGEFARCNFPERQAPPDITRNVLLRLRARGCSKVTSARSISAD